MFNEILNNYDIKPKSITKLNKGYASQKWIIVANDNNKYILKEIINQDAERLTFILCVQNGIENFAPMIKRCKNNSLFCNYDNKLYYISEFVESTEIIENSNLYYELGLFLSNLHTNLKKLKGISKMEFLKIENYKEKLLELMTYYQKNSNKRYREIIKYKLNILNYIENKNINFNNLSYQIIHGDFYIDNVLLSGDEYKILDFDQTCFFYKEYEVLRGMFMLCLKPDSTNEEKFSYMRKFIKGYTSSNSIPSPVDSYNLYLYIQTNSLSGIRENEYLDSKRVEFAEKKFNILKFLYENIDEIINILRGK